MMVARQVQLNERRFARRSYFKMFSPVHVVLLENTIYLRRRYYLDPEGDHHHPSLEHHDVVREMWELWRTGSGGGSGILRSKSRRVQEKSTRREVFDF